MISVGELMTRDPYTLRPDDTLETARGLMTDKHIRHVPVVEDHHSWGLSRNGSC